MPIYALSFKLIWDLLYISWTFESDIWKKCGGFPTHISESANYCILEQSIGERHLHNGCEGEGWLIKSSNAMQRENCICPSLEEIERKEMNWNVMRVAIRNSNQNATGYWQKRVKYSWKQYAKTWMFQSLCKLK